MIGRNNNFASYLIASEDCVSFQANILLINKHRDKQGLEYWACELANFRCTGEQVGAAFFLSEEMNGYGLSNDEFVTRLYKTFMDRAPEEDGFKYWNETLNSGAGRDGAVLGFTRSEEFVGKCIDARILPY